jgi:predicted DsbA family dithiol-disulfide isomerase
VGLSAEEAEACLKGGTYQKEVDQDWARARAMAVTSVPTFFLGEDRLVGAQPYDVLARFIREHGVMRRGTEG